MHVLLHTYTAITYLVNQQHHALQLRDACPGITQHQHISSSSSQQLPGLNSTTPNTTHAAQRDGIEQNFTHTTYTDELERQGGREGGREVEREVGTSHTIPP